MAALNIVNVSNINGTTNVANVTTVATAIVTNAAASNHVYKINALYVSNITGSNNSVTLNVDLYRSSNAYNILYQVSVPAAGTMDVISKSIYLQEGDALRLTASANNQLHAVCSYEDIS